MMRMAASSQRSPRFRFTRTMRLTRGHDFLEVYGAKVKLRVGPLDVSGRPNQLAQARLGLAISRRAGTAVKRNVIKRRLREAFRLLQHEWPGSPQRYDLVVAVRPHEPLSTAEYQAALLTAVGRIDSIWTKRTPTNTRRTKMDEPTSPRDR